MLGTLAKRVKFSAALLFAIPVPGVAYGQGSDLDPIGSVLEGLSHGNGAISTGVGIIGLGRSGLEANKEASSAGPIAAWANLLTDTVASAPMWGAAVATTTALVDGAFCIEAPYICLPLIVAAHAEGMAQLKSLVGKAVSTVEKPQPQPSSNNGSLASTQYPFFQGEWASLPGNCITVNIFTPKQYRVHTYASGQQDFENCRVKGYSQTGNKSYSYTTVCKDESGDSPTEYITSTMSIDVLSDTEITIRRSNGKIVQRLRKCSQQDIAAAIADHEKAMKALEAKTQTKQEPPSPPISTATDMSFLRTLRGGDLDAVARSAREFLPNWLRCERSFGQAATCNVGMNIGLTQFGNGALFQFSADPQSPSAYMKMAFACAANMVKSHPMMADAAVQIVARLGLSPQEARQCVGKVGCYGLSYQHPSPIRKKAEGFNVSCVGGYTEYRMYNVEISVRKDNSF